MVVALAVALAPAADEIDGGGFDGILVRTETVCGNAEIGAYGRMRSVQVGDERRNCLWCAVFLTHIMRCVCVCGWRTCFARLFLGKRYGRLQRR